MIGVLSITIENWRALAPNLQTASDWQTWLSQPHALPSDWQAPAPNVPAMQRRRFSALSRLVLTCAQDLPQSNHADFSVFASRHSEIVSTFKLLEELTQQAPISPMGFSQSVHNTSAGLFTLIEKIQQASTTIAAQQDTFAAGLIEAASYLHSNPTHRVLFVCFDSTLVKPYQGFIEQDSLDYCMAFLLTNTPASANIPTPLTLTISPSNQADLPPQLARYPQACHFLHWWLGLTKAPSLALSCGGQWLHVAR